MGTQRAELDQRPAGVAAAISCSSTVTVKEPDDQLPPPASIRGRSPMFPTSPHWLAVSCRRHNRVSPDEDAGALSALSTLALAQTRPDYISPTEKLLLR